MLACGAKQVEECRDGATGFEENYEHGLEERSEARLYAPHPHDGERVEWQGSHSSSEQVSEAAAAEHQEMLEGAHALPAKSCGWATAKDRPEGD